MPLVSAILAAVRLTRSCRLLDTIAHLKTYTINSTMEWMWFIIALQPFCVSLFIFYSISYCFQTTKVNSGQLILWKSSPKRSETSGHISEIKVFQTPPTYWLLSSSIPQRRRDDVKIWNPYLYPEIWTAIQGDLHRGTNADYFPRDTDWTPRDAGWKRKYDTGDTKQPVRLFLSVTPCMPRIDSKKSAICIPSPHYLAPLPVIPPRTSHPPST